MLQFKHVERGTGWLMSSHVVVAWGCLCVAGMGFLWRYESIPGMAHAAPRRWPQASTLALESREQYTLLVMLHPKCPCSRATLRELDRLMTHCGNRLRVVAVFVRPEGAADGWEQTDLWRDAAAMPGVAVQLDVEGREAQRFGAETSGQALLYSPKGELVFQGGITASRGHEGDNSGSDAITTAVLNHVEQTSASPRTRVYGCPLRACEQRAANQPEGCKP